MLDILRLEIRNGSQDQYLRFFEPHMQDRGQHYRKQLHQMTRLDRRIESCCLPIPKFSR